MKRILIDGGYIEGGKYYYYLNDHLGNNRVVAEANGTVVQQTQYYPFGMDVWSTNDPDQIAQLLRHLQAVANKETSNPFNYGGWNRMSDNEYKEANKDNSVSFNDDKLSLNINLDEYQADFNVSMRGKDSKNAYITSSNLEQLFEMDDKDNLKIESNAVGLAGGAAIEGLVGPYLHKTSRLAKAIFPPSRIVGNANHYTSITSAGMRRLWPKVGGVASKIVGGAATPIGIGLMSYESWSIGRELGKRYGGDAWVRNYRNSQRPKTVIKPMGTQ